MYKLLIVEDEKWEREGLVDFLDWSKIDIEVVGAAANGVQGLKLAREKLPDIIITDIRMPIMDGMEFIRQIKHVIPDCHVIIITGYDDFEYAREAIELGVYEYLLKPVQREQLLEVLDKTLKSIIQDNSREEYLHAVKSQLAEKAYDEREKFLLNIIDGELNYRKSLSFPELLNESVWENGIVAAIIKFDEFNFFYGKGYIEKQTLLRELYRRIRTTLGDEVITAQKSDVMNEIIMCLPAPGADRNHVRDLVRRIRQSWQWTDTPEAVIGVGPAKNTLQGFAESFVQAKAALDKIFFMNEAEILFFDDICQMKGKHRLQDYVFLTSSAAYTKKVMNGVVALDTKGLIELTEELFEFIRNNAADKSSVSNYVTGLVSGLATLLSSDDVTPKYDLVLNGNMPGLLNEFIKLEDMKKWFLDLLLQTNYSIIERRSRKEEYIVGKVMSIIREEYKSSIGIETIAARLGLSPNYLGGLFKKRMGKRFTEALTDIRMKKAEELLISGKANVNDISREVGFVNAAHFCTVFKKTHGMSPTDYQKKCLHKDV